MSRDNIYEEIEKLERNVGKVLLELHQAKTDRNQNLLLLQSLQERLSLIEQSQTTNTNQLDEIISMLSPPLPDSFRIDLEVKT